MANQGQSETLAHIEIDEERMAYVTDVGRKIASALADNPRMFQEHAALLAGISKPTYYRWLAEERPEYEPFQAIVLKAVYEQAESAEETAEQAIGCCENGSGAWANWYKWKLGQRYRTIYGDLAEAPKRIEHSGPGGGAIQIDDVSRMSEAQLIAIALPAMAGKDGGESE